MPVNRDTTNSCSQCEKYAKRIEELEAEVEKWRATCENDDWAGLKREQILEAEIERLTTEKSKGWTEAIKVVNELQALEALHDTKMSQMNSRISAERKPVMKAKIRIHSQSNIFKYKDYKSINKFTSQTWCRSISETAEIRVNGEKYFIRKVIANEYEPGKNGLGLMVHIYVD